MKGLEGVIVDRSSISLIDGNVGRLIYRGYDIHELVDLQFEGIAFLLWNGELPSRSQLNDLKEQFSRERSISDHTINLIRRLPASANALDVLRTTISTIATGLPLKRPDVKQAISITAKIPTINAAFDRIRNGKSPVSPVPEYNHAQNYLYMMTGEEPDPEEADALNKYLILLADHAMNASTFTARIVASTLSDMYSAIIAAICALKGPLHGGAPAPALHMLQEIGKPEDAEAWIRSALAADRRIMGFGHRVYRTTDPRAEILRSLANRVADRDLFELAQQVEQTAIRLLRQLKPGKALYTNVDYYSALVLHSIGLPADLFTATFAASRSVGWSANILEQDVNNRLIRPKIEYIGPYNKKVVPLAQRSAAPTIAVAPK
jgi:citrate synthase